MCNLIWAEITFTNGVQVFVSPYGHGEWTDLDFQAIMCGCLVIKAGADSFKAYPNVFEADNMALSVKPDWSDLKEAVQRVMQVRFFTQDSKSLWGFDFGSV